VSRKRSGAEVQDMLAESIQGHDYYSDDFQGYKTALYWPAINYPMNDKSETYSVEGSNTDLRHYLACLRRKSRCSPVVKKLSEMRSNSSSLLTIVAS